MKGSERSQDKCSIVNFAIVFSTGYGIMHNYLQPCTKQKR